MDQENKKVMSQPKKANEQQVAEEVLSFEEALDKCIENPKTNFMKVGGYLAHCIGKYDFNAADFTAIKSVDDLIKIKEKIAEAKKDQTKAWRKFVCRDCGNESTFSYNEVKYYEKKNFELPKRCPDCKENAKKWDKLTKSKIADLLPAEIVAKLRAIK